MARRTQVALVDDLDGSPATSSHVLALDGHVVELDLSPANATRLAAAVAPFLEAGRTTRRPRAAAPLREASVIRTWAARQGMAVTATGRIPHEVLRAYVEAQTRTGGTGDAGGAHDPSATSPATDPGTDGPAR